MLMRRLRFMRLSILMLVCTGGRERNNQRAAPLFAAEKNISTTADHYKRPRIRGVIAC